MVDLVHLAKTAENSQSPDYNLLVDGITELISTNFEQLLQLLYTIDVSEKKMKEALKDNPEKDAAVLIADLIIERQVQKNKNFSKEPPVDLSDEERW